MRKKNALTQHFIARMPKNGEEPEYYRLANWISNIEPSAEEETEDIAYYDGDGTPTTEVLTVKMSWSVEGTYDDEDPAHRLIRELEFETGEGRKIMYKQVRPNGDVLEGPATVTEPITTGGEASAYEPLSCTITWDRKPEITSGNGNNGGGVEG